MAINKVIYGGETLIDLTSDTVTPDNLLKGASAHDKSGKVIQGNCEYDANTSDATAAVSEILHGKTAYVAGNKVEGTMVNNGAFSQNITSKAEQITIPIGFHDGSGKISIDATEQAKLIAGNIKNGVTILGVTGELQPSSSITVQEKTVTPSTAKQTIIPDTGTDYLSQVVVEAIPYVEATNSAGGTTVTIAG